MSYSTATTFEQLDTLLDYMDEHQDLARGQLRTADGRTKAKKLWEKLTKRLNCLGGSVKTVQQWQKVWTDRKHMAKKSANANKKSGEAGTSDTCLAAWEQRILDIIGESVEEPHNHSHTAFHQNSDRNIKEESSSSPSSSSSDSESLPSPKTSFRPQPGSTNGTNSRKRKPSKKSLNDQLLRVTSGRGPAAERPVQTRLFQIEAKRLLLEKQKISELRGVNSQLTELTSTLKELTELAKTFLGR